MKKIVSSLFVLLTFAGTASADEYMDPQNMVVYTYEPGSGIAMAKAGYEEVIGQGYGYELECVYHSGSPDATGDIAILDRFTIGTTEYVVTSIGEGAFRQNDNIKSVSIPETITDIGDYAFAFCNSLTAVQLPSGLTQIASALFRGCKQLVTVNIPSSVSTIDTYAFQNCSSLASLTLPAALTFIGRNAFYDTPWYAAQYDEAPEGVFYIGPFLFGYKGNKPTGELVIKEGTKCVCYEALHDCNGLTSVAIPPSIAYIDFGAFNNCTGLSAVYINDLTAWCGIEFTSGYYSDSSNPLCYAHHLYLDGKEVTDLVIPEGVTSIGSYAFDYCTTLASVTIPDGVTSIGTDAFRGCGNLTCVTIPPSMATVEENAFIWCKKLDTVHISDLAAWCGISFYWAANPLWYGAHLYLNKKEVTDLVIPEGITSIGDGTFWNCSQLTSITIPEGVTSIGEDAFHGCNGLMDIYCHAKTVPNTDKNTFTDINLSQVTLHVPAASIDNYQSSSPWNQFGAIVPLETKITYHPFLKEGKTWNYQEYYHNLWNDEQWTKEVSYVINGTTEIDGKTYYKMYRISEEGKKYYCALREENRKVWQYTSDNGDHLLYDFGMSVGDSYRPSFEPYYYQLTSIKPMCFHYDQILNVLYYDILWDPTDYFASAPIVEGVGCEKGWNIIQLYAAQPTNGIIYGEDFLSCYEDGKCIFTADDFNNLPTDDNMADVKIDETTFPDSNFRNWVLSQEYGADGVLTNEEMENVTSLNISRLEIHNLKGIEYFAALKDLNCMTNKLTTLDLSKNTTLEKLECVGNRMTTINLSQNKELKFLNCGGNSLIALDVSRCTELDTLACSDNQLTALDVSKNTKLICLVCYSNQLTSLDLSKNTALRRLHCNDNQLTTLDVSKNTALTLLVCSKNQLTTLDVTKNSALTSLSCMNNKLTTLYVSGNKSLESISCFSNQLTSLDVSGCSALKSLGCNDNQLTTLCLSGCSAIMSLDCRNNQLSTLDLSENSALTTVYCLRNQIKGKGMDALVESLPTVSEGSLYVMFFENEQNAMTITQVAVAKAKGWIPYRGAYGIYEEYAGTEAPLMAYRPFVEEGKTWVVEVDMNQATKVIPETFTLRGDTLVNGKVYKRFYEVYNNEKEGYRGAFREENRRVYFLPEKSTEEELYYDFTLHTGDTFFESKVEGIDYEVYIDDSIQTCGHALHRLGLFLPNNPEYASDASVQNLWIEGVGSLWGPEFSIYLGFTGSTMTLRSCRVGDEYIYKDTMHDFITSGTSWIDGYTRDNQILLNRHHVAGTRGIDGKTYTVMQVQQYNVSPQHEVTKVLSGEYLLREDADGEAWLRMENPTEMAALYDIEWDAETIEGLTDRDLYLFNTRARSAFHVTYGCISSSDETEDKWQTVNTTSGFFRHHVLNDGSYTWWRDALHGDTPQLMVGVGWLGYGPFYGLGETSDGGKRIFPVLYEDGHVVYEDKEALETLGTSSSELWDITTQSEDYAYRPFVEEGKVWKVGDYSGNPVQRVEYYYFDGDTIIDGKTCKQMMCQRYVNQDHPDYAIISQYPSLRYVGAWYEENKKVYEYNMTNKQFKMMYDFLPEANDTLQINYDYYPYVIGPRQTGGIEGFKGVYRDVMMSVFGEYKYNTTWLEGVGSIDGPMYSVYLGEEYHALFLMSCTVGDEVIYLNDEYEDGATPESMDAKKNRFDFTHTIKTKPHAPIKREKEQPLYGEYNNLQLDIRLNSLDDTYLVRITNEEDQVVYEKTVNAGNIVALSIDISAYAKGRYTVTMENSGESFTGEFEMHTTGIETITNNKEEIRHNIYDLSGRRLEQKPQKGIYIRQGKKYVR